MLLYVISTVIYNSIAMKTFRDYKNDTRVSEQYKKMRMLQTFEYAKRMKIENYERLSSGCNTLEKYQGNTLEKYQGNTLEKYQGNTLEKYQGNTLEKYQGNPLEKYQGNPLEKYQGNSMNVIDAIKILDNFVDNSDPDINLSNIHHLFQTAEGIRRDGHPEWMQLVGLIHDLGKIMFLWGNDLDGTSERTQWGVVGDTYILGCKLRNNHVYPEFDNLCPDMKKSNLNTDMGIYCKNCGFDNCTISWGHDEYLYDVLTYNREIGNVSKDFPIEAYYMIRFHSFYPWHSYGEYTEIESDIDKKNKEAVQLFNKYDLYTKENKVMDIDGLSDYYEKIILKYFPNGYLVF
jgi:inositol oxygenase